MEELLTDWLDFQYDSMKRKLMTYLSNNLERTIHGPESHRTG